jgi:NAD(P)-dependent dehydrogenase (short-subunit alcohol dehydrogenase family)
MTEAESKKAKENHMSSTSILQGKYAVIFGAGSSIGTAVAREFAAEGAEVLISGRPKPTVEAVAHQIVEDVVKQAGKIDVILDAAGPLAIDYGNGKIAVDLPVEQFMVPWRRWFGHALSLAAPRHAT